MIKKTNKHLKNIVSPEKSRLNGTFVEVVGGLWELLWLNSLCSSSDSHSYESAQSLDIIAS